MSDPTESKARLILPLTTRQIRLRYLTIIVLCAIGVMIVVGFTHPFFSLTPPAALTDHLRSQDPAVLKPIRKAFAAKLLMIGSYWAVCIVLTLLLPILAWLYTRDIQIQELTARRDIWRELSGRERSRAGENVPEDTAGGTVAGNGSGA